MDLQPITEARRALAAIPELQGAVFRLRDYATLAMVGGMAWILFLMPIAALVRETRSRPQPLPGSVGAVRTR